MSTTNAFALLSTDANDSKIVAAKKKEAPKKVAKKAAPAPAPAPAAPAKKAPKVPEPEVRGSKIPEGAMDRKRGGRAPGKKLAIQRTGNRPPKREFDRHDGTGRAHEGPRRKGAGRGNWGKVTDQAEEEKHEPEEEKKEKKPEPELTEEEKAAKELREKQRTVDQYMKEQKGVKTILHTAAPVEVECSVDEKNFAPITRVDLVAEQEKALAAEKGAGKKAAEPKKAEKKAPKKAKKEEAVIDIQFSDGRREHHPRENTKPVKLSTADEKAFPSLA